MNDDEVRTMFDADKQFDPGFEEAILQREAEIETASDARLAELLLLADHIDCYYAAQSGFLGKCAREAARRLSK